MKQSKMLINALEMPSDAMLWCCVQVMFAKYQPVSIAYLPLANRVIEKAKGIMRQVRKRWSSRNASSTLLSADLLAWIWCSETWEIYKLKNRERLWHILGPTHEKPLPLLYWLGKSYKQLREYTKFSKNTAMKNAHGTVFCGPVSSSWKMVANFHR